MMVNLQRFLPGESLELNHKGRGLKKNHRGRAGLGETTSLEV